MSLLVTRILHALTLSVSLLITVILSVSASASSIYNFEITDGIIHTSGGIFNTGIGDLSVSGIFRAEFTSDAIHFSDADVVTSPTSSFMFPNYDGIFDGNAFAGTVSVPGFGTDSYIGVFDGFSLQMIGEYSDPFPDGIVYNYTTTAVAPPVPLPTALLLFVSGLAFMGYVPHRLMS